MYDQGLGLPQDSKAAHKWYKLAAKLGNALAQKNLALSYMNGEGVLQNHKAALKWLTLSAENGFLDSISVLGMMHKNGWGIPRDNIRAHMWFNIAVSQGDEDAREDRDFLLLEMTSSEIKTAQRLAEEWVEKHGK